jgi:uncharacterized protein (TIGR03435 family)
MIRLEVGIGLLAVLLAGPAMAQAPAPAAVTVQWLCANADAGSGCPLGAGGPAAITRTSYTAPFATVADLISAAYGVDEQQITGATDGLRDARYRLQITSAAPVSEETMLEELQGVLAKAFQLSYRLQDQTTQALSLEVGPSGPKFQAVPAGGTPPAPSFNPAVKNFSSVGALVDWLNSMYYGNRGGVAHLVVDKTGLSGSYDIELNMSDFNSGQTASLLTLVEEQLGLTAVLTTGTSHYFVVDKCVLVHGTWTNP